MIARKIHYKMNDLLTSLSTDEINCIKDIKYLVNKLNDDDLVTLVRILVGNRYDDFIERIKGGVNE